MIELERHGRVAVVTLNRPPVNAIDEGMISAFQRILDDLEKQADWSVLHIRSAQKIFSAGADLDLIRSWKNSPFPGRTFSAYIDRLQALYQRLERLPQITFCEIGGATMGGGYELALACDLRMAADEAKIGLPEVGIGLVPGAGGTQRLTRLCGRSVASRIILACETVDGRTAATLGMVQWSVPRSELAERSRTMADRISKQSATALHIAKQCIAAATDDRSHGYRMEKDFGGALLDNKETQDLIAAFLEKTTKTA
ncbi:MAG: enoyl-CoA hydratase/isomerase family protein [Sterolibacterium sp.]